MFLPSDDNSVFFLFCPRCTLFHTSHPVSPSPPFLLLLYRSREFLIASCSLYQSDLRLRKPTAPQACSVLACSSTNRLWPTCSFSSRLHFFHQVGILIDPDRRLISPLTFLNRKGCIKNMRGLFDFTDTGFQKFFFTQERDLWNLSKNIFWR